VSQYSSSSLCYICVSVSCSAALLLLRTSSRVEMYRTCSSVYNLSSLGRPEVLSVKARVDIAMKAVMEVRDPADDTKVLYSTSKWNTLQLMEVMWSVQFLEAMNPGGVLGRSVRRTHHTPPVCQDVMSSAGGPFVTPRFPDLMIATVR